jgi:hypothetical protein
MRATKLLTGLSPKSASLPDLARTLAEAGLELWQAPEGFWAVRLKQAAVAAPVMRLRRPARRTK